MLSELSKLTFSPFILSIRYKHMELKPKNTRKSALLRVILYGYAASVLRVRLFLLQAATCVTRFAQPFVNREAIHRRAACMILLLEYAPYAQFFRAVYSNTHMLANQEYYSPQILDRVLFSSVLGSPQVPL